MISKRIVSRNGTFTLQTNHLYSTSSKQTNTGLFGMRYMRSPESFIDMTCTIQRQCDHLSNLLRHDQMDAQETVKSFDLLSSLLCEIMDSAECIRFLHRDINWIKAAEKAYEILGANINTLNSDRRLMHSLERVLDSKNYLSREAVEVASLLHHDFQKYGAHLPTEQRKRVVEISNRISDLSYQFTLSCENNRDNASSILIKLLDERLNFANILGYRSYSDFFLQDKMAGNVETVQKFIEHEHQRTREENEKNKFQIEYQSANVSIPIDQLLSGASAVFHQLFGITFKRVICAPGEIWSDDVQRIDVISDETKGKIGTIYVDISSKTAFPAAHFTVRCSRRIDNDPNGFFNREYYQDLEYLGTLIEDGVQKQLPTVVLVSGCMIPGKLSLDESETLFHELGHALHSVFARTEYQHVSGTRCKLDFVETPSILMEYIFNDSESIKIIADGDQNLINGWIRRKKLQQRSKRSIDQLYFSLIDLEFHSRTNKADKIDDIHERVCERLSIHPHRYHFIFSHISNYGSGYYSYLWCRNIAEQVYTNLAQSSLSGKTWRDEALKFGGSLDPKSFNWEKILNGKTLSL